MKTQSQVDCCATNYRLPETNVSVLGFYEIEETEAYRKAIVYLDEADGLWYESRLVMRGEGAYDVAKPDLWCDIPEPRS